MVADLRRMLKVSVGELHPVLNRKACLLVWRITSRDIGTVEVVMGKINLKGLVVHDFSNELTDPPRPAGRLALARTSAR